MAIKAGLKRWVKKGLLHSGIFPLAQRLRPPRVLILRYHSVQDDPEAHAHSIGKGLIHTTAAFREQMELVARRHEPITLDDLVAVAAGARPMPRRGVAIAFDDGYADNYELAAPILDRLGLRAAFYVTVDCIEPERAPWFCRVRHAFGTTARESWRDDDGRTWHLADPVQRRRAYLRAGESCARRAGQPQDELLMRIERELGVEPFAPPRRLMMTWEQARALRRRGHIVGSHTLTHPNLAQVRREEAFWELGESKRRLEAALGGPVDHFSYPSPSLEPHWNAETVADSATLGYRTAVTCTPGGVAAADPLLHLRRLSAPLDAAEFSWALECAFVGRYV